MRDSGPVPGWQFVTVRAWGTSKEKVLELLDYVKQEYILKPDKKPTFLDL